MFYDKGQRPRLGFVLLALQVWGFYLLGCLSCWRGAVRSSKELKAASNAALSIRFDWQKFSKFLKHCSKFVLHSCA